MPHALPPPPIYGTPAPSPTPALTVEADVDYESQYGDVLFDAEVRKDLAVNAKVMPYADLLFDYDTKPILPELGQVYEENAIIPAFGFRFPFGYNEYGELFAQAGYSFGLRGTRSYPETRYGFDYARDYGVSFQSMRPHAEVDGEITDYSRFAGNVIGYVEGYYDLPLAKSLRPMVGTIVSADTHRDFGNNYAEAYTGFLVPISPALDFRLLGVAGVYLSRGVDVPSPRSYSTFRLTLTHSYPP